ncbi:MAG: carbohydrate kinase family protein [Candidatus Limnocylindrales bacterium]
MSTIVPVDRVRPAGRVRSIRRRQGGAPSVIVVGDLTLDVVLLPARALETATDVPGRVMLRQGGSAATTARWLARIGARSTLVTAVGRDPVGRALVARVRRDRVSVRAVRAAGLPSGRIGVLVTPDGERSFVADRGASDLLTPGDLREGWFTAAAGVHLPAYSLLGEPLGLAGRRAVELGRAAGARISVDLASSGPLLAGGRAEALALIASIRPDLLFATESESAALLGRLDPGGLLDLAPIAIVKRGARGATILVRSPEAETSASGSPLRLEVATRPVVATDTTGAGDAFDAGFLVAWLSAGAADRDRPATLRRSVVAGHRAAARQLSRPPEELDFG